jgi:hypothetical protein
MDIPTVKVNWCLPVKTSSSFLFFLITFLSLKFLCQGAYYVSIYVNFDKKKTKILVSLTASGALSCEFNNGGCWKLSHGGKLYSACHVSYFARLLFIHYFGYEG